jgi:hypothetical protein
MYSIPSARLEIQNPKLCGTLQRVKLILSVAAIRKRSVSYKLERWHSITTFLPSFDPPKITGTAQGT